VSEQDALRRTAFVTGGTGFVGANLARALLKDGWRLRALARPQSDRRNLEGLDLEIVEGDLCSRNLVEAMRGVDVVFHVAARYSLWRRDADALYRDNVLGTKSVLAAAREAGVPRTVYTSSVAAIGVKSGGVADESYQSPPERLIGAYKRSKYFAEQEALAAARAGQDVVIVNPTTPLGPWDRKPTPTGDIFVRFLTGHMPAIVETGLNFVDVADVVRGHILAYERGRSGERYILGGENLSLRELLRRIGEASGKRPPRIAVPLWLPLSVAWLGETFFSRLGFEPKIPVEGVRMSREAMFYDASKAIRELGYEAGPLDPAIREAIGWFASNGYLSRKRTPQQRWQ
jgi:dihydroflavonol-4-reductase